MLSLVQGTRAAITPCMLGSGSILIHKPNAACSCVPGFDAILCAVDPFLTHEEVRERGRLQLAQDGGTPMLRFVREPEAAAAIGRASLFIPHTAHHYKRVGVISMRAPLTWILYACIIMKASGSWSYLK